MSDFIALDFALALRDLGLSVIPVRAPEPGAPLHSNGDGKTPCIPWKRFQSELATSQQIRGWFAGREMNIGVVTGAVSGIVVVDTDSSQAEEWALRRLPSTPWRVRTAKGMHRYYRHPGIRVANRARLDTGAGSVAIDTRGDGGFVVGPGSHHRSGVLYVAQGNWRIPSAKLPTFWPGWLESKRSPPEPRPLSPSVVGIDATARARAYLRSIPSPIVDHGSDAATFYAAARLVKGFGLGQTAAVLLLQEWAPAFDRMWIEKKVEGALKYATEPVGGLLEGRR